MKRLRSLWPRTLRAQLILLLLIFWLVPLGFLGAYTVLVYRSNVAADLRSTMDSRIYYAALLTDEKLKAVISTAREISYDTTPQTLNDDYARAAEATGGASAEAQAALEDGCLRSLEGHFGLNSDVTMAVMVLDARPDHGYSVDFTEGNLVDYYTTFVARRARTLADGLGTRVAFIAYNDHLYLVRRLRRTDNSASFGRLILELNTDTLCDFLLDAVPGDEPFYLQFGSASLALRVDDYSVEPGQTITREMSGIDEDASNVTFNGWFAERDFSMGYRVPLSVNYLYGYFNQYNILLLGMGVIAIVFCILMARIFNRRFSQPLESLSDAAWALSKGQLGAHAQGGGSDEVGDLIVSFNDMSDRMKELFDRSYREQLALKDARIIALQSQINPHFFNNTLELMNWKARMLGDEQLSGMITALSVMLDSAMDRSNTRFVTLKSELDVADAYLTIIQARFGRRMNLEQTVDEALMDVKVPRMILQPLLENAVVHGLEPVGGGTLSLDVQPADGRLQVRIVNDGAPLTEADLAHIDLLLSKPIDHNDPRSQRLGIRNVNERLTLIYGPDAGLRFEADDRGRTLCRFSVPLRAPEAR